MSLIFQLQSFTPVGSSQLPSQRLRHQTAFCCRNDQGGECQSQLSHGSASLSGAFLSGSVPPARLCAGLQRKTARQALTTCRATTEKQTIAVTGATGLVGSRLVSKLTAQGNTVRVLTRNPSAASNKLPYPRVEYYGPSQWASAVQGTDAVINLAGEPISSRWTPAIKAEIKQSRIGVTRQIVEAINAAPQDRRPQVFISTSAIGFYGTSESQTFSEASSSGCDYLAEVCRDWEAEAQKAKSQRTVIFRTGIVLAREGGALGKMLPVFNIFAGGPLGSGRQWCSWIHRDDLVNMYIQALQDRSFSGVYNATAPNPVRMSELCSSLGGQLGRPSWLPVPDFALQAILGEGATIVLEGQRVIPKRAQEQGFGFTFENINAAMKDVVRA